MKRTDIERMISLADDRYIDEIFQDKITGKRKNIFVTFAAVAAALAIVAGGIGYFVSNAGNADKITADNTIITEVGTVNYSSYFQNTDPELTEVSNDEWFISSVGIFCYFSNSESEYLKSVMPFDMSGFVNANCHFYYDHNDELKTISMYANDEVDDSHENVKMLYIDAHREGEFFPHLPLEKCKSMKRFDVDVYGFDFLETDNTLGVLFAKDGIEYLIGGDHMSYDEIGVIMDSLIANGLWADRFDLSRAEMEYYDIRTGITLAEANKIEPFAGHVPNIENIGGMHIGSSKGAFYYAVRNENNEAVPASLTITYSSSDMDGGWNNEINNDMVVVFYTDKADVKPFENIFKLEDAEKVLPEDLTKDNKYAFTIDCGNFMVNIETENCTDDELWTYIDAIKGDVNTTGVSETFEEITLAEANHIFPFAGYVPQVESIGTMRVISVYYDESTYIGGGDIVVIVNLMDDNDKNMIIHYGTFKEKVRDKYVPIAEVYDRFESFSEQSKYNADCRLYKFTIDCGNFWIKINADCTPEEMQEFLNIIIAADEFGIGSLEYSNNLEPFAGYVPTKQDVLMYDREELGELGNSRIKYLYETVDGDGALVHMHLRFYRDTKNLFLNYYVYGSDVAASRNNGENAIPLSDITLEILEPIFGDGNSSDGFIAIDCGKFFIEVQTENCSAEDVWAFVSEIKEKPFMSFEF